MKFKAYRFTLIVVALAVLSLLTFPLSASATSWTIDGQGNLHSVSDGRVLGKGSDDSNDEPSGSSVGSDGSRDSGSSGSSNTTSSDGATSTSGTRDARINLGGTILPEVRDRTMRLRLEIQGGKTRMKLKNLTTGAEQELETDSSSTAKNETEQGGKSEIPGLDELEKEIENLDLDMSDGIETEHAQATEPGGLLTIKEHEGAHDVTIDTSNGHFLIRKNRVGATTSFPLSIDLSTNTLSVTTPAGEKSVAVLPDEAVQQMLNRNLVDRVGSSPSSQSTEPTLRLIQTQQGILAYEVNGVNHRRLLGLFPIDISTTALVSAENGELISSSTSLRNRVLGLVSF